MSLQAACVHLDLADNHIRVWFISIGGFKNLRQVVSEVVRSIYPRSCVCPTLDNYCDSLLLCHQSLFNILFPLAGKTEVRGKGRNSGINKFTQIDKILISP